MNGAHLIRNGLKQVVRLILGAVALLILFLGIITITLSSERGTGWLLTKADQQFPQFSYQSANGSVTRGLNIRALEVNVGELTITVSNIDSRWRFWDLLVGRFTVDDLRLKNIDIYLPPSDPEEDSTASPWPSLSLPLMVYVADARLENLTIHQDSEPQVIQQAQLKARMGPLGLNIRRIEIQRQGQSLRLEGRIAAKPPYAMTVNAQWSINTEGAGAFKGDLSLGGTLENLTFTHTLLAPYRLQSDAKITLGALGETIDIAPEDITLSLQNQWSDLNLTMADKTELRSNGRLHLEGGLTDYRVDLEAHIAPAKPASNQQSMSPPLALQALGSGADLALNIRGNGLDLAILPSTLSSEMGGLSFHGSINADALVEGEQRVLWDVSSELQQLNIGQVLPEWPATLSSQLHSQGEWQAESYQADITIASLKGAMTGTEINGNGKLTLSNHHQQIDTLNLTIGSNRLTMNGANNKNLNAAWTLNAPTLAEIYPPLSGALQSRGQFSGSLDQPFVRLHIDAKGLTFQEYQFDALKLTANLDDENLTAKVNVSGMQAAALKDADITLNVNGNQTKHQIDLNLKNQLQTLALSLTGGLKNAQWLGQLSSLNVNSPQSGPWQQSTPAKLRLAKDDIGMQNFCLRQDGAQFCSDSRWHQGNLQSQGSLTNLGLNRFVHGLPEGSGIEGTLQASYNVHGQPHALRGQVQASTDRLVMHYKPSDDDPATAFPAAFDLNVQLDGQSANADAAFTVADFGAVHTKAKLDAIGPDGNIKGEIQGGFHNLQWLGTVLPQLEKLDGSLDSQLFFSGTVAAPSLQGSVALHDAQMEIPAAGLILNQGEVVARIDETSNWVINASIASKSSQLNLNGNGSLLGPAGPRGKLLLTGDNFLIVDIKDAKALISPNLSVSIEESAINIRGDLSVNEGFYHLKSLPTSATKVSADEYIIDTHSQGDNNGRPLNTQVRLTIDDTFRFEGLGISTRLGGALRIRQTGDAAPQAYGSLNLYDGFYKAFGQKLDIESGTLIFQGPLDNPGLNITAMREVAGATVGIRIGGFAQDIRSELFSDPAMSPTDTMAILVTGKAPSQLSENDANQVMNAAAALGISQSAGISNTLKNTFGLDVLTLQSGDTYTESSLVVGKYLNPKLFVSYVQNLFTPAGAVQLDYSLTKNLGLKAQSGKAQSIDLLYKVEHGK